MTAPAREPAAPLATPQERLPLWRALAELFLDTEKTAESHAWIVREIRASGLRLEEVEAVLWHEVYPVLKYNLISIAGVWDGWSDEWLLEHLRVQPHRKPRRYRFSHLARMLREMWQPVLAELAVLGGDNEKVEAQPSSDK